MNSLDILKYKYERGTYDIQDLKKFVEEQNLTQEEFFEITRLVYNKKNDPITSVNSM